jgi:hypothetical protein
MADELGRDEMYAELRTAIDAAGGEAAFARIKGIRRQEVNDATRRRRPPNADVLAAIGLMPVTRFLRVSPQKQNARLAGPALAVTRKEEVQ